MVQAVKFSKDRFDGILIAAEDLVKQVEEAVTGQVSVRLTHSL